ncbi:MAG TPA: hypothetical protein VGB99_10330 [Acidobacteriota bacterium]
MLALRIAVLLGLLAVGSVVPGFCLLRRLRWRPLELLCGSIGLSLILIYLVSFGIYAAGLPPTANLALSVLNLVLLVATRRDWARMVRSPAVRRPLLLFGCLLIWALLALSLVRHYAGGGWGGDWLEHFQRTLVFAHGLPPNTPIVPGYTLPARPPLMNAVAAHFLAQVGDDFELFSISFLFLNLSAVLGCALLLKSLARRGGRGIWVLGALLACNPLLIQSLTYTWTKLLAAFYALLGLALYLAGWRRSDPGRTVSAFGALAAGMLVHFSIAPYALVVLGHYTLRQLRERPVRWPELARAGGVAVALLATWFGFATAQFGVEGTVTANTTVIASRHLSQAGASNLAKMILNLFDTVVPHPLRTDLRLDFISQASAAGYVRDYLFLCWQTNLILAMGTIGGLAVLYLLIRALPDARGPSRWSRQRRFWLGLAALSACIGVIVVGEREPTGVAHVTLQPLVLLGVSLLAASFAALPAALRWTILAACLVDFGLGVFLHHHLQNAENRAGGQPDLFRPVVEVSPPGNRYTLEVHSDLSRTAAANWLMKHRHRLVQDLARTLERSEPAALAGAGASVRALARRLELEDERQWAGWYRRHGGRLSFLGDRLERWSWQLRLAWLALLVAALAVLARAAVGRGAPRRAARSEGLPG